LAHSKKIDQMLSAMDEIVRMNDLKRLYGYMLEKDGEIIEVIQEANQRYTVKITYKVYEDMNGLTVSRHVNEAIVLKPAQ